MAEVVGVGVQELYSKSYGFWRKNERKNGDRGSDDKIEKVPSIQRLFFAKIAPGLELADLKQSDRKRGGETTFV